MCQILLCSYSLRGHTQLARQPPSVKSRAPSLLRKLVFTCLGFLLVARFEPHLWWAFDSSPIGDSTGRVGDKNDATRTQCSRFGLKSEPQSWHPWWAKAFVAAAALFFTCGLEFSASKSLGSCLQHRHAQWQLHYLAAIGQL